MKLSDIAFYITIPILLTVSAFSFYFIAANTFLKTSITPTVLINDISVSVDLQEDLEGQLLDQIAGVLPSTIIVEIEGDSKLVKLEKSMLRVLNTEEIADFGSGSDFTKVIADGVEWVGGVRYELSYSLKTSVIEELLPIKLNSNNFAKVSGGYLVNCESGNYNFSIDQALVDKLIYQQLQTGDKLSLSHSQIFMEDDQVWMVEECRRYLSDLDKIKLAFDFQGIAFPKSAFSYSINSLRGWQVVDQELLLQSLNSFADEKYIPPDEGYIEKIRGIYAMLKPYKIGRKLDVASSYQKIRGWLLSPDLNLPLKYIQVQPRVVQSGVKIYDFTKHLASGKTRLDLVRNGSYNWVVDFAEYGVLDMQNRIVMPGETFSYIDTINPQPGGWMISGRPIGVGICNSATTVFRAAIEAGFPIVERSYHVVAVPSYSWGYEKNVVDAVYLSEPRVDLKFKNDLDHPILLKAKIRKDTKGGFQYHTIEVYTSSETPDRKIELYDFKTWNHTDQFRFEGQFRRRVIDDGEVVRNDKFYSDYRWG